MIMTHTKPGRSTPDNMETQNPAIKLYEAWVKTQLNTRSMLSAAQVPSAQNSQTQTTAGGLEQITGELTKLECRPEPCNPGRKVV